MYTYIFTFFHLYALFLPQGEFFLLIKKTPARLHQQMSLEGPENYVV